VFHPVSKRRLAWMLLGSCMLGYDVVVTPMQLSGLLPEFRAMQFVVLAFWCADIFVNFITGYYKDYRVELSPGMTARHYFKTWFLVDFSIVMFDFLSVAVGEMEDSNGVVRLIRGSRLPRLLRLFRLLRLLRVRSLIEIGNWIAGCLDSERHVVLFRVFTLIVGILVLNHFIACLWYLVGTEGELTWLTHQDMDTAHAYAAALHWSLTQFTPATQNLAPISFNERIVASAVVLIALITFSTFLGKMTSAMTQLLKLNAQRYSHESKLRRFFSENDVPENLAQPVWRLFRQQQRVDARQQRIGLSEICDLVSMPRDLLVQLSAQVFEQCIFELPILRLAFRFRPGLVRGVCSKLKEHTAAPGHTVFASGVFATSAVCVTSGQMRYERRRCKTAHVVERTAWVAEAALWGSWKHLGSLIANSAARWVGLEHAALWEGMQGHEDADMRQLVTHYLEAFEVEAASQMPISAGDDDGTVPFELKVQSALADNAAVAVGWTGLFVGKTESIGHRLRHRLG